MHSISTRYPIRASWAFAGLLLAVPAAFAQVEIPEPPYVGRFVVYTGAMLLESPHVSLAESGIHVQAGMRYSRHISLGFDYSRSTGNTVIGMGLATTALQNYVNPLLQQAIAGGILPSNYVASLPISSVTQTFTAGPEFPIRRWRKITPYIRPSAGLIQETATAHGRDTITRLLVHQIAPSGSEQEWTAFYGFGGGIAFNANRHFSLIVQADFVHDHLFPNLLRDGRNTIRFSFGPGFQFGGDVKKNWGIPGHWR